MGNLSSCGENRLKAPGLIRKDLLPVINDIVTWRKCNKCFVYFLRAKTDRKLERFFEMRDVFFGVRPFLPFLKGDKSVKLPV